MTPKELRELDVDTLLEKETELRSSIFKARFQSALGGEGEAVKIRPLRRDIARIKTILSEKKSVD